MTIKNYCFFNLMEKFQELLTEAAQLKESQLKN